MRQVAEARGFEIVLVHLSDAMRRQFERTGLLRAAGTAVGADAQAFEMPDLDAGIEYAENGVLLAQGASQDDESGSTLLAELEEILGAEGKRFLKRRELAAGEYLMRQGEDSSDMLFVVSGQVTVLLELANGKTVRLRTMRPGTVVGEVAWYRDIPRTASVVADRPTVAVRLSKHALDSMEKIGMKRVSEFHKFMARRLCERLTDMNDSLRAAFER
jgi:SulP family sulfate permease